MIKFYFTLLNLFVTLIITGQNPQLEWAKPAGSLSNDYGQSITVDRSGNVYTTGYFRLTVDFDPGIGRFDLTSVGNSLDVFIQKLDAKGEFVWAKSFGGLNIDKGHSIATDDFNNVYIVGDYKGQVDFDPDTSTFNLVSFSSTNDVFIQKLDSNGNFIWAKSIGNIGYDEGRSIAVDYSGNILIAGAYEDTTDFDPSTTTFNMTSNGNRDVFILKLDPNGNFIWAKSFGGIIVDACHSIATDQYGNILTTGFFYNTVDFNPNILSSYLLTSVGGADIYLQKLDSNGNFIWAKSMGSLAGDHGNSVTVDNSGNICLTGYFANTVDFDPGPPVFNLTSNGYRDVFVQKLNSAGEFIWAKSFGGFGLFQDWAHSIVSDSENSIYIIGDFQDSTDFDPNSTTFYMNSNGSFDVFVEKLDSNGNFIWAISMGDQYQDVGNSIALDKEGSVYLTGYFQGTPDFDPGPHTFQLISAGVEDIFVQKINQCDLDISVTNNDPIISSNAIGVNYQWLDCNNSFSIINGATSQSYTATSNGHYAVIVTKNTCIDTSSCISVSSIDTVNNVGINGNYPFKNVKIFPNPNQKLVNIDLGDLKEASLKIFNASGEVVYQNKNIIGPTHQFELKAPPGFYILELSANDDRHQFKLLKK